MPSQLLGGSYEEQSEWRAKRVRVDAKDNQKALTDCTESRLRTDNFFL